MSSRLLPFGSDTLAVPAYLAKGDGADDPGLARWKQEHPDWFVAGTWIDAPRRRQPDPPVPGDGTRVMSASAAADLAAAPFALPDPATLSLADFRQVAAEARSPSQPTEPSGEPSAIRGQMPTAPAASELAYPDTPPPEAMHKDKVRFSTGYIFRLPNGQTIPDDSRTLPRLGHKRLSPTGLVMTPYPDSASEVAAAGRRAGLELNGSMAGYSPDIPPMTTMSQDATNFAALTGMAVGQGGIYDYQREGTRAFGYNQHPQFRAISNFNVGLFCQQAGLSLEETLGLAGSFANILSGNTDKAQPYGLDRDTAGFIEKGWHAGESGMYGQATRGDQ